MLAACLAGDPLASTGFPSNCPQEAAVFNAMNAASYQVFGELLVPGADGQPELRYIFIGTAWAVRGRVLVTNAHVTEAFNDTANQGVQFTRAIAVQSGTGEVVRLLRAFTHPDYSGDPLGSPDVGLFTSQEVLPEPLPLAPPESVLGLGEDLQVVGFPGDVDQFIQTTPGQNIPQATSLSGEVTARRSHDATVEVGPDTLDIYQHQAPTTPGTSGSAMVHCGLVVGVNNAGTVKFVVIPPAEEGGEFQVDRQAAASNNFGVHVKHIHDLLSIFDDNALQGYELPVKAQPVAEPVSEEPVSEEPVSEEPVPEPGELPGTYTLRITTGRAAHEIELRVGDDGEIEGTSVWPETGEFTLAGKMNDDGTFRVIDDAPERLDFRQGVYVGQIAADGTVQGIYYEETREQDTFAFAGRKVD